MRSENACRGVRVGLVTLPALGVRWLATILACWCTLTAWAGTVTWDGGAADNNWSSATNWVNDTSPIAGSDALVFDGSTRLSTTNDYPAGSLFLGLTFNNTANAFTLSGNSITLGGDVTNNATANQRLDLPVALGSAGRTFTVASGGRLEVSRAITGSQGLTKDGTGTLMLTGTNTYTGATVIMAGTVRLGVSTTVTAPVAGATMWLDASQISTIVTDATGHVSQWSDRSGRNNHATQATAANQPLYVPAAQNGLAAIRFDGSNDQLFFPTNAAQSVFIVTVPNSTEKALAGIIGLQGSDIGVRRESTADSAVWRNANGNDFCYLTGSTFYVNGAQTYTHPLGTWGFISAMRAAQQPINAIGSYFAGREYNGDIGEILVYTNALSTANRQSVEAYLSAKWFGISTAIPSNALPPATALQLAAGAVLDLYGGAQRVSSLTDSGGAGGTVTNTSSITATLIVSNNTATTFSGSLAGNLALTKLGTGRWTLAGTNTFTGGTTINAGTLQLASSGTLTKLSTISVASNAVLDVSALSNFTVTNAQKLTGSGSVTGLVTLASGGTLSPSGTLTLKSGLTLHAGAVLEFTLGLNSTRLRINAGTFTGNNTGQTTVRIVSATGFGSGTYTLLDWTGATASGVELTDFTLPSLPAGLVGSLAIVGNTLQLTVIPTGGQSVSASTIASLRLAIQDLASRYPTEYAAKQDGFLARLTAIEANPVDADYQSLKRDALVLNNPALAFNKLMFVRRSGGGLPQNWQNVTSVSRTACNDAICVLDITNNVVTSFYVPPSNYFIGYLNLHWNADRLLFTSINLTNSVRTYGVFEIKTNGTGLQLVSPNAGTDIDWYDACYLPNDEVLMCSTAPFAGVPCVTGADFVGNMYRMNRTTGTVRQLTFDQDQNWGPTILEDGRVMFTRWEYSDAPHYFSRVLFTMMPDGLEQFARYGSDSYWPNTLFDARPIPGKPSQFVGIVSGHHGTAREGELILFDENKGMQEAQGVVHRFLGTNPIGAEVMDYYIDNRNVWPRFLQPSPLDEKQMVVSMRTNSSSSFGLYLVDQFDNVAPLCLETGYALLHATPIKQVPVPPVIPDRVKPTMTNGTVNISDVYFGPGLRDVPRGKVKQLRVYTFHYAYRGQGGHANVAIDGAWDVHRIMGTVPVYPDGSASFRVPANVPISLQPLDEEGKAVQQFRSWYTVMPGETVSCAGCHERRNDGMINQPTIASRKNADDITPWLGPERGFSFTREVQPVLDTYCSGCHGGSGGTTNVPPDLFTTNRVTYATYGWSTGYTYPKSYLQLHPYVRRPGNEGYYRNVNPGEWHADNSELVQLLQKGHYGVTLDTNAWDRLITWIDLNVPCWGTWGENTTVPSNYRTRRLQTMQAYASITNDPEVYPTSPPARGTFVPPGPVTTNSPVEPPPGSVFDVYEARNRRNAITNAAAPAELSVDLGGGVNLILDLIPAGTVLMGSVTGYPDEAPPTAVTVTQAFYMAKFEVSNQQFAKFDATHHSGFLPAFGKDHNSEGWACTNATQPAIRVSWAEAMKYCEWLTKRTGRRFTLPTEAQWEYAARAGTTNEMWYGDRNTPWTNQVQLIAGDSFYQLGRRSNLAGMEYHNNPTPSMLTGSPRWFLAITNLNDSSTATATTDTLASNPFGLVGITGNAAEWTRSTYAPYPYTDTGDRNRVVFDTNSWATVRKVVRGGSFMDRPLRATSSFRTAMPPWQRGYNVGFRVVADVDGTVPVLPVASFTATPTNGPANLTVQFNAAASTDADGTLEKFDWNFGDGALATGTNRTSHTYTAPGTYPVTLTVTDNDGFTATQSANITVTAQIGGGSAPVSFFTATPDNAPAPCRVQFDSNGSTDFDGTITAWYWSYGDATFGTGSTGAHTYTQAGRYNVALTVVDNSGLRTTWSRAVTVTGTGGNQAPVVDAGFDAQLAVTDTLALAGNVTDDGLPVPPGSVATTWSQLSGPGTATFADTGVTNTTATFSTNGTYVLQLAASDGELSATDSITVDVLTQAPYHSPCEVAYSTDGALLAVADRTARGVVVIDPLTTTVQRTIALAGEPYDLVWRGTNTLFVSEHGAGTVAELDAVAGSVLRRWPVGPKPAGLAIAPGQQLLLVTDRGLNKLSLLDLATGAVRAEVSVVREPVFVTVTPDEHYALVANRLPYGDARDPGHAAAISFVNLDNRREVDHVLLPAGATSVQRIVCSPDGRWAYVTHVLGRPFLPTTQLSRGWVITSALSILDLASKQVYATVLFDQSDNGAADPWGLAVAANGQTLWATMAGVHEAAKLNLAGLHALLAGNTALREGMPYDLTTLTNSNLLQRVTVPGDGSRGIALAPNQQQLAVAAYYAGNVLLLDTNCQATAQVALAAQPVEVAERRGERLYYDATGCYQHWLSCNSCHPGARADGFNWDLMNDGFGNSKNTKSHLYAPQTPPSMWTGVRSDAMVGVQAGYKFIEFQAHPTNDYNDILAFMTALKPEPSPDWVNGRLTPDAVQGKAIFESAQADCLRCHRPNYYYGDTNKYVVGTAHEADWTANDLTGYIPPTLHELWRTAPYLHDGSAVTMRDVLTTFNATDQHGRTSHLTDNQIDQLAAYLLQIGGAMPEGATDPYSLMVYSGAGSGQYLPGSAVTITANLPPPGMEFDRWTGANINDATAETTTLLMPDTNLVVAAEYKDLPGLPDTDLDGQPDSWTWRYFGHATGLPDDRSLPGDDADNDGVSNLDEYTAGTNPLDPTSRFQLNIELLNGECIVQFPTLPATGIGYAGLARRYSLERRTDLNLGDWGVVPGCSNVLGLGQSVIHTNDLPDPAVFFRGRLWLQ